MTAARVEPARRRVEGCEDVLGAGGLAGEPPRRHVGVVVEAGADDAGAGAQRLGHGSREGEGERRHVGAEADAVRAGAEQLGDHGPRPLEQRVAVVGGGERPAAVGVGTARRPVGHGGDGAVHHLRAGGTVEAGPAVAHAGEARHVESESATRMTMKPSRKNSPM